MSEMMSSSLYFPTSLDFIRNRMAGHSFHVHRLRQTLLSRMRWLSTDKGGLKVARKHEQSHRLINRDQWLTTDRQGGTPLFQYF